MSADYSIKCMTHDAMPRDSEGTVRAAGAGGHYLVTWLMHADRSAREALRVVSALPGSDMLEIRCWGYDVEPYLAFMREHEVCRVTAVRNQGGGWEEHQIS